jgi:hypothetical protein
MPCHAWQGLANDANCIFPETKATIRIVGASRVRRVDRLGPLRLGGSLAHGDAIEAYLTSEGYLRCAGRISGCGVYQYDDGDGDTWGELRVPEEVFAPESLASWNLKPVTDGHPGWVTADNVRELQRGQVGTTWTREGDYLRGEILITDAAMIEKIRAGTCELSCAYDSLVVQEPGELDGVPYAHKQTQIRGNAVGVVEVARGGPECRLLLDGAGVPCSRRRQQEDERTMDPINESEKPAPIPDAEMTGPIKIMIAGVEHEVSPEVAAYIAELEAAAGASDDEAGEPEPASKAVVEGEAEPDDTITVTSSDSADAKRKHEDAIETRVRERAELLLTGARVCGLEYAMTNSSKSDTAIQLDVIGVVLGDNARKRCESSGSADYTRACFDSALEQHAQRVDSSGDLLQAVGSAQSRVEDDGGFAAAAAAHLEKIRNGSQKKAS